MGSYYLIPFLLAFGLFWWGKEVKEEHPFLTLAFQWFFIPLVWVSLNLAIIDAEFLFNSDADMIIVLSSLVYYVGWLFFAIGVYYFFVIIGKARDIIINKRQEREEARYG